MYTCKVAEDNTQCFQVIKHIVQGTEAEVDVDEFNIHSELCTAWRKLYNTFLGSVAKYMLAAQLEKIIQNLWYSGPKCGFTFSTYVECHKTANQFMLSLSKKMDYTTYNPSTCICHFLNGFMDPALA